MQFDMQRRSIHVDQNTLASSIYAFISANITANKYIIPSCALSSLGDLCKKNKHGITNWILDSGASHHMTMDLDDFSDFKELEGEVGTTRKSSLLQIKGIAPVFLHLLTGNSIRTIHIHPVLYAPKLSI